MKKYTVIYSSGRLEDIAELTASASSRFVDSLIDTCDSLQLFPYRGTERAELRPNMRIIGHRRAAAIVSRIEEKLRLVVSLGVSYADNRSKRFWLAMNNQSPSHQNGARFLRSTLVIAQVCAGAALLTALNVPAARAQSAPCGISSLQTIRPILYPPIGKVAHVQGTLIVIATFAPSGAVTAINLLSGPELLKKSVTGAMLTWTANPYSGPRECPLVIEFQLVLPKEVCDSTTAEGPAFFQRDNQHFVVRAGSVALCDPPATITKRHRFLHF